MAGDGQSDYLSRDQYEVPSQGASAQPSSGGVDAYVAQLLAEGLAGASSGTTVRRWTGPYTSSHVEPSRVQTNTRTGAKRPIRGSAVVTTSSKKYTDSSVEEFAAEFWDRWQDNNFRTWLTSRLVATGRTKAGETGPQEAFGAWVQLGEETAKSSGWTGTPEQLLDFYATGSRLSADAIEEAMKRGDLVTLPDGTTVDPNGPWQNPIQSVTRTSTASINQSTANMSVDDLSRNLLGRMASEKELSRYRDAINGWLEQNPTVETTTTDSTDPDNVQQTTSVEDPGMSAQDALNRLEFKMRRGSEGMAFNVGKMFEDALRMMGS